MSIQRLFRKKKSNQELTKVLISLYEKKIKKLNR